MSLHSCALALASFALIEVHKVAGGHGHLHSWHARLGVGAFGAAVVQPIMGWRRPGKQAWIRPAWLWAHRLCGIGMLGAGIFATVTGVLKAASHGEENAAQLEAMLWAALAVLGAIAVPLELWRWRGKPKAMKMPEVVASMELSEPSPPVIVDGEARM